VKVQGVAGGFAESGREDLLLILHNAQRIRLRFIYGPDGDSVGFDARGFEEGAVGKKDIDGARGGAVRGVRDAPDAVKKRGESRLRGGRDLPAGGSFNFARTIRGAGLISAVSERARSQTKGQRTENQQIAQTQIHAQLPAGLR
jgi:hypothetical protein